MTAPISVDPTALSATGNTVGGEGDAIAAAIGSLDSSLSGAGAMFGHDAAGLVFAQSYTASGKALLDAAASAVNACRRVGFGVQMSAANYGHANASSTVGGGTSPVPVPTAPAQYSAPGMPPPFGEGVGAPMGWALVEAFVGDVWPDGNPGEMRAAAGAWRSFGTAVSGLAGQVEAAGPGLSAHQIPEAGQMVAALGQIGSGLTDLATQAQAMATAVDGFANTVDGTQDAVRGLLHQLSPSGVLETIGGIFTGHNPIDEIRKVAHEIKTVLDNMKREADASGQIFSQGINILDSATDSLEKWASKEFTDVLGQDVGGALSFGFTAMVDESEGAFKFVAETAQGISQLDPTRFAYDPAGAAKTWEGLAEGLAVVTNPALLASRIATDPQGSLDTVKGLVDWKDVEAGHPFRAVGYNGAQIATAFIPGVGEAEPAIEGAGVAGRAASVDERAAASATRDAVPGLAGASSASESVGAEAGRVGSKLDGINVPETATPGAAPGESVPAGRAPVETAPPGEAPRPESGVPGSGPAPEVHASEPHSPSAPESPTLGTPPSADPVPRNADPPPPLASHTPEPAHVADSNPRQPPLGGGSYESAPAASDPPRPVAHPDSGAYGAETSPASGADDKVPVSVGAHAGESHESAVGGSGSDGSGRPGGHGDHEPSASSGDRGGGANAGEHAAGHASGDSAETPIPNDDRVESGEGTSNEHHGGGAQTLDTANHLNDAFAEGLPTDDLARAVAEGSTHRVGDSDRVVLGKWDGQNGGYIGEARHHGGIYFDTGNDVWNAVEHGLDPEQAKTLGWQVNEQFLRTQMEQHVSRIEYMLPDGFDSVDQVARVRRESFSALEINFLNDNAARFGYVRDGNSWVFRGEK